MTRSETSRRSGAWDDQALPAGALIEEIEGRWTLQILLCLKDGEQRFSDLRAAIPRIGPKVLTERLRTLERAGLVERHFLPPPSARHVYVLASSAVRLKPALDALANWQAEEHDISVPALGTP